ncbi:MAG: hypothetical protein ABI601_09485 [bacterium]
MTAAEPGRLPIRRPAGSSACAAHGSLFDQMGVPDVTEIDGLPPAVALQQQRGVASTGNTLYVLDEPTTGLHPDVDKLLAQAARARTSRTAPYLAAAVA